MLPPLTKLLRDAVLVLAATLLAGFLVAITLGETQRGTSVWLLAVNLTNAVLCIAAFFVSAHLATTNRFVHVWIVAALASLPNLFQFAARDDMTFSTFLVTLLLFVVCASIGGCLSYAFRRSRRTAEESVV
jgi:hypothetical protein